MAAEPSSESDNMSQRGSQNRLHESPTHVVREFGYFAKIVLRAKIGRARAPSPKPVPSQTTESDQSSSTSPPRDENLAMTAVPSPEKASNPAPTKLVVRLFGEGLGHFYKDLRAFVDAHDLPFTVEATDLHVLADAVATITHGIDMTLPQCHFENILAVNAPTPVFSSILNCPFERDMSHTQGLVKRAAEAAATAGVKVFILTGRVNYAVYSEKNKVCGSYELYNVKSIQVAGYKLHSHRRFKQHGLSPKYKHHFTAGKKPRVSELPHNFVQTVWILTHSEQQQSDLTTVEAAWKLPLYADNQQREVSHQLEEPLKSKVEQLLQCLDHLADSP